MSQSNRSPAQILASLPAVERAAWLARLTPRQAEMLRYDWGFWGRPNQISPWSPIRGEAARKAALEKYRFALWLGGRGSGKTRPCAQAVIEEAAIGGEGYRIALVGRTRADPRDVMIEGESGILAHSPPDFRPTFFPSLRKLVWPNGATAYTFSADEDGDQLRGPQFHFAWVTELAAIKNHAAWDTLLLGVRLDPHPRILIDTTPKPRALLRQLVSDPQCWNTKLSTYDNKANLSPKFIADIEGRYSGTRLEREQIFGDLLDEAKGALWSRKLIDETRVDVAPELVRIVVAVDPSVADPSKSEDPAECGIIVAGLGVDGDLYFLKDLSGVFSPGVWAERVANAWLDFGAGEVVAESNQGGALVSLVISNVNPSIPVRTVHASIGKSARAEPIVHRFEQGRAHIVGRLRELEDQLCSWTVGTKSPDRLDAMVWAGTALAGSFRPITAIADTPSLVMSNPFAFGGGFNPFAG